MTTQPKRLTAEDEANVIASHHYTHKTHSPPLVELIASALRKRDELYAKAWEECKEHRDPGSAGRDAEAKHDAARRAAGLEDA